MCLRLIRERPSPGAFVVHGAAPRSTAARVARMRGTTSDRRGSTPASRLATDGSEQPAAMASSRCVTPAAMRRSRTDESGAVCICACMPSMATPSAPASKRRNQRVFVPPLSVCQSDGSGFPVWLRPGDHPGGRWRRVGGSNGNPIVICNNGPTLLPQLQRERPAPQRYGRPPLTESEPERVEFAAWAHDVMACRSGKSRG
jgi:hypothetical protein